MPEAGSAQALQAMASLVLQDVTHQLVQQFIAELADMLEDVQSCRLTDSQTKVLRKILAFFDGEMQSHHLEEDRRIFPLLLKQNKPELTAKVRVLQVDHEELVRGWATLRAFIEQAMSGSGVSPSLRPCFEQFSACFVRHLALEESIQFSPEARDLFLRWDS